MNRSRLLGSVCACLLFPALSMAAIIGPGDFGDNVRIVDYDNLGWPDRYNMPRNTVIDGDVYDQGSDELRYLVGPRVECISEDCLGLSSLGDLDITLQNPANRVGIWMVRSGDNTRLYAYDSAGNLIGRDDVGTYVDTVGTFYGFESLTAQIASVRLSPNSISGGFLLIGLDNFTTEAVPLPAAAWLFGSGLLGLIGIIRKRAT